MSKVDIISGFLGAGKTTFIRQLISDVFQGEKIVLIENEFGEIGIDGGFLKEAGIEITEMNSGCICCTLVGDFSTALMKVVEEYHPDRIIIEPSGVGKLSDVAKAVEAVDEADIELNSKITVVDGKKAKLYMKNFGEFFNNQIEHATTIVLSRTQMMTDAKLEECVKLIKEKNDSATIITTPWDELDGNVIAQAIEHSNEAEKMLSEEVHHGHHHEHEEDCGCHEHHHAHDCDCGCHDHHDAHGHHHHHHADEVFTSWGKETVRKYTKEELTVILEAFSNTETYGVILRAKGIVQAADGGWLEFDFVPGEYEVRAGHPDYTGKLCVIGTKLDEKALETIG